MKRVSIPLVGQVEIAETAKDIAAIEGESEGSTTERRWSDLKGLLGILLRRRIATLAVGRRLLPVFRARADRLRASRTAALQRRLEAMTDLGPLASALDGLARAVVAAEASEREVERLSQEVFGRLFRPDFRASPSTLEDASTWRSALEPNQLKWLWPVVSGRFFRARRRLSEAFEGDTYALHAVVIAYPNFSASVLRMKEIDGTAELSTDAVLAQCLVAPATSIRTRGTGGPLALIPLRSIREKSLAQGEEKVPSPFGTSDWSLCPASGIVPRLLAEVFERSARIRKAAP